MAQGMKIPKYAHLVVETRVRIRLGPFQGRHRAPTGILFNTPKYTGIDRSYSYLKSFHEVSMALEGGVRKHSSGIFTEKNTSHLNPANKEVRQHAFHDQSTFLEK